MSEFYVISLVDFMHCTLDRTYQVIAYIIFKRFVQKDKV